jgi:hypothetical protein
MGAIRTVGGRFFTVAGIAAAAFYAGIPLCLMAAGKRKAYLGDTRGEKLTTLAVMAAGLTGSFFLITE